MMDNLDTMRSKAAVKEWVELYSDNLYSWALYKTSSKEVSEDLVQETFLAAFQSFAKFEEKSNVKTWLLGILNNKINDYHRANFRKPKIEDNFFLDRLFDENDKWKPEEKPLQWSEEQGNLLDDSEFQQILEYCLKSLPSNWFSAIQLKYFEVKNGDLICQELDISPTNFWQILHRAKLQLRKCLEINWFKP
jgi:RNA polymerase sigma-70 factor (TIGR02943 family)